MGAGNVGCCDNNTAHKNSEVSIQSVTYREASEDFCFSPNLLFLPRTQYSFAQSDQTRRIRKLEKVKQSKTLELTLLNSNFPKIRISFKGMENSARQVPDGYVFFGCKLKENLVVVNDYKFRIRGTIKREYIGRCFVVYFKIESKSFWVKDLNKGPGLFIKLDFPLVMKDSMVVNIGNSFLAFKLKSKINSNPELEVRKLGDDNYSV